MGRFSSVEILPPEIRQALEERLRAKAYGDLNGHSDWLKTLGHEISKSSIHRYAQGLQGADRLAGRHTARVRMAMRANGDLPTVIEGRAGEILAELGRVAVYERSLMDELRAIMVDQKTSIFPENDPGN